MAVDEASVDPDPMTQLSRWLESARAAEEPVPEAMAVATATADGRPSSRMVLLRGLDHRGLVFYTDLESDKGRDLKANPFAAALFHWLLPVHRQVTGAVEEVSDDQSDAYWQSRPPGARRSATASHQSEVVAGRAVLEQRVAELAEAFPEERGHRALLDGGATGSGLKSWNCGKRERTAYTTDSVTGLSSVAGESSGYHPDSAALPPVTWPSRYPVLSSVEPAPGI